MPDENPAAKPAPSILVSPTYSFRARSALVSLRVNSEEVQMPPSVARAHALDTLLAASDAESDEMLMDFLIQKSRMSQQEARHTLSEYRLHRAQSRHEVRGFMPPEGGGR